MPRQMYDSVSPASIPTDVAIVGGYIDGAYGPSNPDAWTPEAWSRFPNALHVPIAVFAATNDGIVGDCERGDMTPQTLVQWVVMRRGAGVDPTGYCSEAAWDDCKAAFAAAAVPEPHWWVAGYPGSAGPGHLYPGSVAHQYADTGSVDLTVAADYWPGVDPPPSQGDLMAANLIFSESKEIHPGEKLPLAPPDGGDAVPGRWVSLYVTRERPAGDEVIARIVINTSNGPDSPKAFGAGLNGDTSVGYLIPDERGQALQLDLSNPIYGDVEVENREPVGGRIITARVAWQSRSL